MSFELWGNAIAIFTVSAFAITGVLYTRRNRPSVEGYVSARNSTGSLASTATIVASIMGAWILFGPAEAATWAGIIAVVGYALGQAAPLIAFVFIGPRMRQLIPQGHSLSEFVWFRYGKVAYGMVLLIMVFYMFVFLAAEMGAIARAVHAIVGTPLILTLLFVGGSTLLYTVYGGLRASIFTDNIQFFLIFPLILLVLIAALVQLDGWSAAFDPVHKVDPNLLTGGHQPGIDLAITLVIAIFAANLFHQGFWQRVYASKSESDMRKGFLSAGLIVVPLIMLGGLFGLWAIGQGVAGPFDPIALFKLAIHLLPSSLLLVLMVLALVLVMSSMDTLLNGIASIFASDLPRLRPELSGKHLLFYSRLITILFIIPAMIVGYLFDSVLYLFFIADLVCAAAVIPIFFGLYVRRYTGTMAVFSSILGMGSGAIFFPTKNLAGWWTFPELTNLWHVLASGNTLASFLVAILVSGLSTIILTLLIKRTQSDKDYDFSSLANKVKSLDS